MQGKACNLRVVKLAILERYEMPVNQPSHYYAWMESTKKTLSGLQCGA